MKIDFSLVCFFFMKETIRTLFLNFSDLHPLLPTIARKLEVVTISIFLLTIFNLRISAYLASQNLVNDFFFLGLFSSNEQNGIEILSNQVKFINSPNCLRVLNIILESNMNQFPVSYGPMDMDYKGNVCEKKSLGQSVTKQTKWRK